MPNDLTPDELDKLVVQATGGDRDALEALLLHFHDPLLAHLEQQVTEGAMALVSADDAVQDALTEAAQQVVTIEPRGHAAFFAWLKTIARTRLINRVHQEKALKRGGGQSRVHTGAWEEDTATSILDLLASSDPTASRVARRREALMAMKQALTQLDPEKRAVLELRHTHGLSMQEIAQRLGKSEPAVKMMLSRTLTELRRSIETMGEFTVS